MTLRCHACHWTAPPLDPRPFRCPNAGKDGADHLLVRIARPTTRDPFFDPEPNPFVRFRTFTHAWHVAMQLGVSDAQFVALVRELDDAVERVDGRRFRTTRFFRAFDDVWAKDETPNVAGSHKARHLMGLMLWLRIASRLDRSLDDARLAIASCGNAALAAAVLARAAGRTLDVFVPDDAEPDVIERLRSLGASVTFCPRIEGRRGDPAYLAFRDAVACGALPFTCQGNENGLVIEGGETLGWELGAQLAAAHTPIDDLWIQVGGGALASAVIAGLRDAVALGVLDSMPRIHTVQTESAHPLERALVRVRDCGLEYAIGHRSAVMWPWESTPHSIAHGILDDETYDWAAVVRGMLDTGGRAVVVSEERLAEARSLAHAQTGIRVTATGTAGLAGLLEMQGSGAVVFTG